MFFLYDLLYDTLKLSLPRINFISLLVIGINIDAVESRNFLYIINCIHARVWFNFF